jgi:GNAT superfamily N-acetyltransferase
MIRVKVNNLYYLKILMNIRNEVRSFMTGSSDIIDWESQQAWFSHLDDDITKIWLYGEEVELNNNMTCKWLGYGQLKIEFDDVKYGVSSHAIVESARGRGHGEHILSDLILSARAFSCNAMRADIFASNQASLGLVHKLGYQDTKIKGDIVEVKLPL